MSSSTSSMIDDGELVRAALNGQRPAYETLVHRWGRRVVALCHARVSDAEAAEDLAQETLLRGWKNLQSLREPDDFGPWLRRIADHVCLDWIRSRVTQRKAYRRLAAAVDGESTQPGPHVEAARQDEERRVLQEIHQLPQPLREVVLLYYYEEITYDQIAAVLGVARATVNTRLAQARCLLARRLTALSTQEGASDGM